MRWSDSVQQGRLTHAALFAGPAGTGKRAAACWAARRLLYGEQAGPLPMYPVEWPEHADFHRLTIPEDKQSIGIEQVRALVAGLGLTSYEGRGKVAVVEPGQAMTQSAANSLLKTLEEPPGNVLIVIVADRLAGIPATIVSRCQRSSFAVPAEQQAVSWLDQIRSGVAWGEVLRSVGGAPLAALAAAERLDERAALGKDLQRLGQGRGSPIEAAARWAKLDSGEVLNWLAQQVTLAALALWSGREHAPGLAVDDSVLRRMDRRKLFCYLDIINRLRSQAGGSFNPQLALESLLIDWANGLQDCAD